MIRKLAYISIIVLLAGKSFVCLAGTGPDNVTEIKNQGTLEFLLYNKSTQQSAISEFSSLLDYLESKKEKFDTERQFLNYIYRYVHRKTLKRYKKYVSIDETLSRSGSYDCLTGTLIYSLLLDELGFDLEVREFNYHVLLVVQVEGEKILIESTDPLNGFVVGEEAVQQRISEYKASDAGVKRYSLFGFRTEIDREISIPQLVGLHFYNQSINHLNENNVESALVEISKAYALYPCQRILEVSKLISDDRLETLLAAGD